MAERALRGTRLGATSYENDRNTDLAPRQALIADGNHRYAAYLEMQGRRRDAGAALRGGRGAR